MVGVDDGGGGGDGAVVEIGPRSNQRDLRFRLRVSSPRNGVVQITSSIVSEKHKRKFMQI